MDREEREGNESTTGDVPHAAVLYKATDTATDLRRRTAWFAAFKDGRVASFKATVGETAKAERRMSRPPSLTSVSK